MRKQLKQRADGRYACKYKNKTFYGRSSKEANDLRDAYIKKEKAGQLLRQELTVRDYALKWLPIHKGGVSVKCYNDYAKQLEALFPYIGHLLLSQVTVDDAASVWQHFSGYSASTIHRAHMLYKDLFDTAIENELCFRNPFKSKSAQPPSGSAGSHRALSDDEVSLILSTPHRFRLAVLVMLYAGLRRGEVLALSSDDIDLDKNIIHVSKAVRFESNQPLIVSPKTSAGVRTVPILSTLRPFLSDLSGPVAPSASGSIMSESAFDRAWQSYLHALSAAAGHPVIIKPHDLRHTYCTMIISAGVTIKQAMLWLGHADEKMILRVYDHVQSSRTAASVAQVEQHLSGHSPGRIRLVK